MQSYKIARHLEQSARILLCPDLIVSIYSFQRVKMHFQSLFFAVLVCALCSVKADDPVSQHIESDDSGLERESLYEGFDGNDAVDRQFDTFSQQCLKAHNDYRKKHGVPPLVLDQKVTAVAQNWAKTMAARNTFQHSGNKVYGENIYASSGMTVTGKDPVKLFYDEIQYYNFNVPGFSMATGHFTQVIWKSSKSIGVGRAKGSDGTTFVVVNYYPPGNYIGQFAANVPRKL